MFHTTLNNEKQNKRKKITINFFVIMNINSNDIYNLIYYFIKYIGIAFNIQLNVKFTSKYKKKKLYIYTYRCVYFM